MRTTVTLDPDVAAKVKAEMRRTGDSFKDVLNRLLRSGATAGTRKEEPFVFLPGPSGLRPGLSLDNIEELLDRVEGPLRK